MEHSPSICLWKNIHRTCLVLELGRNMVRFQIAIQPAITTADYKKLRDKTKWETMQDLLTVAWSGGGLVAKSCPTLATMWTVACQAPLSMGFSRQEYWSGLPFPSPGDLPKPGIKPGSPALHADSLLTKLWGKPSHSFPWEGKQLTVA